MRKKKKGKLRVTFPQREGEGEWIDCIMIFNCSLGLTKIIFTWELSPELSNSRETWIGGYFRPQEREGWFKWLLRGSKWFFDKYPEYFCLKIFFPKVKIHLIQSTWGPVTPPEDARVGQSAVVNCFPEYEEPFLYENFSSKPDNSRDTRGGSYFFPQGRQKRKKLATFWFEIDIWTIENKYAKFSP